MVKLYYNVRRREDVRLEEFREHWTYPHAPLGVSDARVLRYVQFQRLDYAPLEDLGIYGSDAGYDGIACAWWQDEAVMEEYMADPALIKDQEDMQFFIDHDRSVGQLVDERAIVEPVGEAPIVAVRFLKRADGVTPEQFRTAWDADADGGPLGAAITQANARAFVQGYLQNHARVADGGVDNLDEKGSSGEQWDGFATVYCNSVATLKALARSDEGQRILFSEGADYADAERSRVTVFRRFGWKQDGELVR